MIVKTYKARNMREAIAKIKKDLGEDAVIISSRKVKHGPFFSFFKKEMLEVTAALDDKAVNVKPEFKDVVSSYVNKTSGVYTNNTNTKKSELQSGDFEDRIKRLESLILNAGEDNIKRIVEGIKYDINDLKSALNYVKKDSELDLSKLPLGVHKYFSYMCDIGINKKYAFKLVLALYNNIDKNRLSDDGYVKEYLSVVISQFFKISTPQKRGIVLVGPTGVGKTTTLAKLSAIYKLKLNKKVGIITTDTYRIGAVDQLLNYAKIMDIPAVVSITKEDFALAFKDFRDMENVFIDTVGRSQKDIQRLKDIFGMFNNMSDLHISLVLAVNTKEKDSFEIYDKFSRLPIDDFIFTKVDETNTPGTMLNLSVKLKKPISYVSFGQDVPDDIMKAEPLKIASLIVKKGSGKDG